MLSRNTTVNSSLVLQMQTAKPINPNFPCSLRWRQGKLWVSSKVSKKDISLPALANAEWFQACLTRSRAAAVRIDPALGEAAIKMWASSCEEAGKPLFLRVPSMAALPQKQFRLTWWLKLACDRIAAATLLLVLAPLMLVLAGLIKLQDGGPIFYAQWRVGQRGQLFRILKFRSMVVNAEAMHHKVMGSQEGLHKLKHDPRVTPLGRYMRKFSLDELPQLINVLRGEMSLVGPRPWAIYDAVRIEPELRHRLNALPGITGAWQVKARSNDCDLSYVNRMDLDYLQQWTFWKDLEFLLLTVPKVLTGSGAY